MTDRQRIGFDINPNGDTTVTDSLTRFSITVPYGELQSIAGNARKVHDDGQRYLASQDQDKQRRFGDDDVAYWLIQHGDSITTLRAELRDLERTVRELRNGIPASEPKPWIPEHAIVQIKAVNEGKEVRWFCLCGKSTTCSPADVWTIMSWHLTDSELEKDS